MRTYLGISGVYAHDASAAIIVDGEVVAAAEEERFTHKKHTGDFPHNAIQFCLQHSNTIPESVDVVSFPFVLEKRVRRSFLYNLKNNPKRLSYYLENGFSHDDIVAAFEKVRDVELALHDAFHDVESYVHQTFPNAELRFVDHHLSHAASAAYPSGFEEAVVIVNDLIGEWDSSSIYTFSDGKLELLLKTEYPDSIGKLYQSFTKYIGFRPNSDEYKVMGLSAYGGSDLDDFFKSLVVLHDNGLYEIRPDMMPFCFGVRPEWSAEIGKVIGPPRKKDEPILKQHADIAHAIQNVTEEVLLNMLRIPELRSFSNLCLAGGVSLNALANQRLREASHFSNIFVQPASNDSGVSMGAAITSFVEDSKKTQIMIPSYYLGPPSNKSDIDSFVLSLEEVVIPYSADIVADLLIRGQIVGFYQGRMEFGPRALGNRSILADPRNASMKDILNTKIKYREEFRPFAPVVLEEAVQDYFVDGRVSPHMTQTFYVAPEKRTEIPAVTHEDGTARIQTINRLQNPKLYSLIEQFFNQTGVPILVNTSLNLNGDTIAVNHQDAYKTFRESGMDALVLEDWVVLK